MNIIKINMRFKEKFRYCPKCISLSVNVLRILLSNNVSRRFLYPNHYALMLYRN